MNKIVLFLLALFLLFFVFGCVESEADCSRIDVSDLHGDTLYLYCEGVECFEVTEVACYVDPVFVEEVECV